jgi:hypothetical protein
MMTKSISTAVAAMMLVASVFSTATAFGTSRIIVKLATSANAATSIGYVATVDSLQSAGKVGIESSLFPEKLQAASLSSSAFGELFPFDKYRILTIKDDAQLDDVLAVLSASPDIEYAEPDYLIELFDTPNDPYFTNQWGVRNVGQSYLGIDRIDGYYNDVLVQKQGTIGADIHLTATWDNENPTSSPLLCIIDTGLDTDHPDISDNLWVNPGEIPNNGIDDDHNGYIDDILGWDFSGDSSYLGQDMPEDNDVGDSVGHGTHVAGIIGATPDNGIGIVGVCGNARLVGLKIFPNAMMSVAAKAILYATEIGADVINMSWGSPFRSELLLEVLGYARSRGVLPVAASGNFGDESVLFPSSYDGVLTVGASNSLDEVTFFSSYGAWVELVAPGRDILSLRASGTDMYAGNGEPDIRIIDDFYYLADGTSMAAPHVVGAAGVVLSYSPGLSPDQLQNILIESADDIIHPYGDTDSTFVGWDRYSGYGRLNVEAAVALLNGTKAKILSPYQSEIITADLDVSGTAYSESAESYSLEISKSDDLVVWEEIGSGPANISSGWLGTLNVSGKTGDYTLRLAVGDDITVFARVTLAPERRFEISSPHNGETVAWFLTVRGSVIDPDFDSYDVLMKSGESGAQWEEVYSSTRLVSDSVLCELSLGSFGPGDYTLRVVMHTTGDDFYSDVNLTIQDRLIGNFPQAAPLDGAVHFASTVNDIDSDNSPEIIVTSRKGVAVFRSDGTPFCCGWPNQFGVDCAGAPAVYDVDQDGIDEIAFCSEFGFNLFDAYGARVDSFPKLRPTGLTHGYYPTTLLADIDLDSNYEMLWIADDGNVYAYRSNGESYFASLDGWFADTHAGYYFGSFLPFLFCVDFGSDGQPEIVGGFRSVKHGGGIYVWQAVNGQPAPGNDEPLIADLGKIRGACVADFNLDGEYDIAVVGRTSTDTVFAAIMDMHGEYLPGWPRVFSDRWNYIVSYPAAADVDGDEYPDLLFTISSLWGDGEIYVLKYDGTPYRPNLSGDGSWFASVDGSLGSTVIGDVSGDGEVDIVVRAGSILPGSKYERIFAFNKEGELLSGWPIFSFASPGEVFGGTQHTPILTDIDVDGLMDLVCTSDDGQVYVWKLETPYDPDKIPWGQFLHDSRNSGILPRDDIDTPAETPGDGGIIPRSFSLGQNYPNPFNSGTKIEFEVDRTSVVTIEIFNLLGQKVRTLLNDRIEYGKHEVGWNGQDDDDNDVASGIYFYRMKSSDFVQTRKMVKLN